MLEPYAIGASQLDHNCWGIEWEWVIEAVAFAAQFLFPCREMVVHWNNSLVVAAGSVDEFARVLALAFRLIAVAEGCNADEVFLAASVIHGRQRPWQKMLGQFGVAIVERIANAEVAVEAAFAVAEALRQQA